MAHPKAADSVSPTQVAVLVPSRVSRAQETAVPAPAGDAPGWLKVRELALRQLNRFISLEPKVLKGDNPDAVHDLRVSSRRVQQVLDLLYPARPKEVRRLRRKIQSARRALSEVRNCDVHLARVAKSLSSKRAARRVTAEAVRDYLVERREESFERALRKLGKANLPAAYVRLKEHLDWRAAAGANGRGPTSGRRLTVPDDIASAPFDERISATLEEVWRDYETQIAEAEQHPEAPVLHGVRIATKRLRYLVEVLDAFSTAGSAEVLKVLRKLQGHLGGWHDLEVFDQMLIDMVTRPKFLRQHLETAMAVGKLMVRNRRAKKGYVQKYFGMTRESAESQRLKDWVETLLARSAGELV